MARRAEAAVQTATSTARRPAACWTTTTCCSIWHGLLATDSHRPKRPIVATPGDAIAAFDCVLVDEYQDTNTLQAEILYRLSPQGKGLTVVGDDAQSIYSFRAATVRNILDFPKHYPERDDRHAGAELPQHAADPGGHQRRDRPGRASDTPRTSGPSGPTASGRVLVTCEDETEQAEYVIRKILEHREAGVDLRRQAVLFRASHHSMLLEAELAGAQHPLPQVRRAEVRRDGPRQGPAGLPAAGREPARHGLRRAAAAAAAGHRAGQGAAVDGHAAGQAGGDFRRLGRVEAARPAAAKLWPKFVDAACRTWPARAEDLPAQVDRVRKFYAPLLEDEVRPRRAAAPRPGATGADRLAATAAGSGCCWRWRSTRPVRRRTSPARPRWTTITWC